MATLKDAERVTERLSELAREVRAEITHGDVDFGRMARLADEIGVSADGLATTFASVDQLFRDRLAGDSPGGGEEAKETLSEALSPRRGRARATGARGNRAASRRKSR
jgi:hypothetical protein